MHVVLVPWGCGGCGGVSVKVPEMALLSALAQTCTMNAYNLTAGSCHPQSVFVACQWASVRVVSKAALNAKCSPMAFMLGITAYRETTT